MNGPYDPQNPPAGGGWGPAPEQAPPGPPPQQPPPGYGAPGAPPPSGPPLAPPAGYGTDPSSFPPPQGQPEQGWWQQPGTPGSPNGAPNAFTPTPLVTNGVAKKRKGPRIAAAAIATTCLVGSGVFAYASLGGSSSGAQTPEAATQAFYDALGNEDVIGMLNSLPQGERRTFVPLLQETVDEMSRLEILSGDADPAKISGIDLEFSDLTFDVTEVSDKLASVQLSGGKVTGSYDLSQLPLGEALITQVFGGEAPSGTDSSSEDIAGDDMPAMVTVKDADGWHVSLWYSVAESARKEAGLPLPEFGNGVPALGADSPEAAVESLFSAVATLDVRRMIELSPPDEMAALHDYAPLFIDDAESAIDDILRSSKLDVELTPLDMTVVDRDGRKIVEVAGLEGRASVEDQTIEFSFQDGCGSFTMEGETQEGCLDDVRDEMNAEMPPEMADLMDRIGDPKLPIATTEVDGKWYISPSFTLGEFFLQTLQAMEPEDVGNLSAALDEGVQSGFDLGASLNNDVLGGFGGPGGGTGSWTTPANGGGSTTATTTSWPTSTTTGSGSGSSTSTTMSGSEAGYARYDAACGDIEFGVIMAETAAEWSAAQAAAATCAAPFLAAGDITKDDLYEEVAYPQCYTQWPYDQNLTLGQQSDLFDKIYDCVEAAG